MKIHNKYVRVQTNKQYNKLVSLCKKNGIMSCSFWEWEKYLESTIIIFYNKYFNVISHKNTTNTFPDDLKEEILYEEAIRILKKEEDVMLKRKEEVVIIDGDTFSVSPQEADEIKKILY